jgi:hypothetical protein
MKSQESSSDGGSSIPVAFHVLLVVCPVDASAEREAVEAALLERVRSELLSDEAVTKFCSLIDGARRACGSVRK